MYRSTMTSIIIVAFLNLNFLFLINTQTISVCDSLNEDDSLLKSRRIRALCDALQAYQGISDIEDSHFIPDFDLTQIETEKEANQILKRFRRSRFSSSSGSRSSSSSSSSSRSSSSSGSRFFGGSSSSGGSSRISSGSSSSSSSGSGSRIFSRSGSSSSSSGSGSRIFSRSGSSSGSGSTASPSGSGSRYFSRIGKPSSSGTPSSNDHRIRESIRSVIRKPTSSGSGISSGSGGLSGTGGSKPSIGDKIRKITHSSGGSGNQFGTGGSGGFSGTGGSKPGISDKIRKVIHSSGGSGNQFGTGGSSGSGGNVWVRTGKKFLPVAVRFGKRYYQRRKYNKGMYAAAGAGAGYYAGSRMNNHGYDYPHENYGYPPAADDSPEVIEGKIPTVFYCIQEDLNTTLVNKTLDKEGFGICNISGELVTCPIEIECQKSEADNCCEDEQGTPYCCGGEIPEEYVPQYGGYEDNENEGTEMLNIMTVIWIMMSTICFTIWQRRT